MPKKKMEKPILNQFGNNQMAEENIKKIPTVAFVGLPNAGKSLLINRICGKQTAIVANEAHTTRDINEGYDWWENMYIHFVDTGGLVPDPADKIQKLVQVTSWRAIASADLLVWVIDRKQDPETISDEIVQRMWRVGKPYIICVNKVDDPNNEVEVYDYVRLGGLDFVNVSAVNGYNLNEMLDIVVRELKKLGFEENNGPETEAEEEDFRDRKGRKHKVVRYAADGSIVVYRESGEKGKPGLFVSEETEDVRQNKISHLIFDLDDVLVHPENHDVPSLLEKYGFDKEKMAKLWENYLDTKLFNPELSDMEAFIKPFLKLGVGAKNATEEEVEQIMGDLLEISLRVGEKELEFLKKAKERDYHISIATNSLIDFRIERLAQRYSGVFDEIFDPKKLGVKKPDVKYYEAIIEKFGLDAKDMVFFDDGKENVQGAIKSGMWGVVYKKGETDLEDELDKIERGFVNRVKMPPKVLMLGKPNVGKSSLFNALLGEEKQIVTETAGTTLSVNDTHVLVNDKEYVLLDTTGIRKAGKRTFGAETFATYRTIEAAHNADVILFIVDGSQPITAQDLLVAGIAKETNAGVVVVVNKADISSPEDKERFVKDFTYKMNFLKIDSFIWTSAVKMAEGSNEYTQNEIWEAVDKAFKNRAMYIPREEVRKVFNYLMKQKPPKKLHNKKRAVIYDLIYSKASPPTFELLVKDRETIHWSYVRFLENTMRRQFGFENTGVKIVLRQISRKTLV